ncbi:unnamed protein product, partial [Larinioides sclopetarius]
EKALQFCNFSFQFRQRQLIIQPHIYFPPISVISLFKASRYRKLINSRNMLQKRTCVERIVVSARLQEIYKPRNISKNRTSVISFFFKARLQ